jgi:hypothetical protein
MRGRAPRSPTPTGTAWLISLGAFALPSCELPDDMVARRVAVSGSAGSGATGGGSGAAGSAPLCDPDLTTVPALPGAAGLRRCSAWAARRVFGHALCSCGGVEVPDALVTDVMDSGNDGAESPRGGASVGINGDYAGGDYLRVDGSLTISGSTALVSAGGFDVGGDVRLRGAASAAGPIFIARDAWLLGEVSTLSYVSVGRDVYLGPAGALSALGATSVRGTSTMTTFELAPPCACEPDHVLDIAGIVADVVSANDNGRIGLALDALTDVASPIALDLSCGRYALQGISGAGPIALRISGRVVLAVDGDVELPPGFSIDLGPEAQLDWFITGNLRIDPVASIGSIERAAAIRTYLLGTNEIALSGAPTVAMNLYAPHADVTVDLAGNVYGGIFAANVGASGLLFVHYDRAVLRADEACTDETPRSCASCDACGPSAACIGGTCGTCTTDTDCCFPLVCASNRCEPLLVE